MTTATEIAKAVTEANAALDANAELIPWEQVDPTSIPAVVAAAAMVEARLAAMMGWDEPIADVNGAVVCRDLEAVPVEGMDEAILRSHNLERFIGRTVA